MIPVSKFQEVLASVDTLSVDEQEMLIDIIKKRLAESTRSEIAANIAQSMEEYKRGRVVRGTVDDILAELEE